MRLVTVSAQYGAGGSTVAPAVAEALGVPFVDRAIPVQVAHQLGVSIDESLAHDDRAENGWFSRWLAGAARVAAVTTTVPVTPPDSPRAALLSDQAFVDHTERVIRELANSTGAVVLGRAAAVVLAGVADALHVRLHGASERRLHQAMALRGIDRETAAEEMAETDHARTTYVRRFYHCDPDDARLYHLTCDSTALSLETITELITLAARAPSESR